MDNVITLETVLHLFTYLFDIFVFSILCIYVSVISDVYKYRELLKPYVSDLIFGCLTIFGNSLIYYFFVYYMEYPRAMSFFVYIIMCAIFDFSKLLTKAIYLIRKKEIDDFVKLLSEQMPKDESSDFKKS